MNWKQHNWVLGCIAVVITFFVLFGGQLIWQKYAVAKPLDKTLNGINGVESVTWKDGGKNGEPVIINVTLKNVQNLQKTYGELLEGSQRSLGRQNFKLIIEASRTPELEQFFYRIHIYVQEAIYTGNFTSMAEKIQEKAIAEGIDTKAYVDTANVYFQVQKNGDEWYIVIPRGVK